jgi:hypothetical protein
MIVNKYTIRTGITNSADERPNQLILKALPLVLVKYLEIVVEAVWDIIPCPENLIKKIPINNKKTDVILEKKKQANDKRIVTKKANLKIFTSSIFFPTQINRRLLHKVADAKIEPNCPWVIDSASLILELNRPRK